MYIEGGVYVFEGFYTLVELLTKFAESLQFSATPPFVTRVSVPRKNWRQLPCFEAKRNLGPRMKRCQRPKWVGRAMSMIGFISDRLCGPSFSHPFISKPST